MPKHPHPPKPLNVSGNWQFLFTVNFESDSEIKFGCCYTNRKMKALTHSSSEEACDLKKKKELRNLDRYTGQGVRCVRRVVPKLKLKTELFILLPTPTISIFVVWFNLFPFQSSRFVRLLPETAYLPNGNGLFVVLIQFVRFEWFVSYPLARSIHWSTLPRTRSSLDHLRRHQFVRSPILHFQQIKKSQYLNPSLSLYGKSKYGHTFIIKI